MPIRRNVDTTNHDPALGDTKHIDGQRHMEFRDEGHDIVMEQLAYCWLCHTPTGPDGAAHFRPPMLLFDCAVGLGEFLERLEGDDRWRCYGIDMDPTCCEAARQAAPSATITCRNALDIGFIPPGSIPTGTYDIVVATALIEHVSDPSQLLKNIYHVTNRWALIMTPNAMRPAKVWDAIRGRVRWERAGHLQAWDYHLFHQQLQYHGFKVHRIDVRFVDFPWLQWWPWLVRKLSYGPLKRWFPMLGSEMFALCEKRKIDAHGPLKWEERK